MKKNVPTFLSLIGNLPFPMLTAKPQLNLRNAKEYFREHLCVGDYYAQGQRVGGEWFGVGAAQLGLKGQVGEKEFLNLCEGLHPLSSGKLTQRMNSNRIDHQGRNVANRRVFYDFTLSPPKSVSIMALLQDDRILEIHDRAFRTAMIELEKFAESRVRKSGMRSERCTGNIVAAAFRHDTSRELDPHLHTHCVVFNATFDAVENSWKALEVQGVFRAQKFVENLYYHELAKGLGSLGYEIQNNGRDFEIKGIRPELITRFSKRHCQIDEEAEAKLQEGGGDRYTVRRRIADGSRKQKLKEATAEQLRPGWWQQLNPTEQKLLTSLQKAGGAGNRNFNLSDAVVWADEHLFERRSVVKDFELASAALSRGRGQEFDLRELVEAIDARGYIRETGTRKITSREVLKCELDIVLAARDGRSKHEPLSPRFAPQPELSSEQKVAVSKILGSRDFISLFRGGAGTGKSFTLKEIKSGLDAAGRPVVTLAPQRQQVTDLCADGLPAETLSSFLQRKALAHRSIVILDEAGQVGGKQLQELIALVRQNAGRLILSGDTRQHGAVAASDALRAIEKHSGIKPAILRQIRRQDPKLGKSSAEKGYIQKYRAAVSAASKGRQSESFERLDRMGCIYETSPSDRRLAVVDEFLRSTERNEKTLIIAQTRVEVNELNEAIRNTLREKGRLGAGKVIPIVQALDFGEAQKKDGRFYEQGHLILFLKTYGRFKKGEVAEVVECRQSGLTLMKDGRRSTMSFRYTDRVTVARSTQMEVATGDRLQLKFNGTSLEGLPLNNGELVTVRRVLRDGTIALVDDKGLRKSLAPSQRIFGRGYAVTSYASQGKTVDAVILGDCDTHGATSAEQWYVTISRARKRVTIFTSNKEALKNKVATQGARQQALDLNIGGEVGRTVSPKNSSDVDHWRECARVLSHQARSRNFVNERRKTPHSIKHIRNRL